MLHTISPVAVAQHLHATQEVLQEAYKLCNAVRARRATLSVDAARYLRHRLELGAIDTFRAEWLLHGFEAANDCGQPLTA
jgi:hypothetical protein